MRRFLNFRRNDEGDFLHSPFCIGFLIEIQLQIGAEFIPGDRLFRVVIDFIE